MFPFFFDQTFILLIPALILAIYAQSKVRSTFDRYSRVRSRSGLTGAQVARRLLDVNGLDHIPVERVYGTLTDHYDPRRKVLRLSEGVYLSNSIAALGVAAHETGHALQHALGYFPLTLRNSFAPVANFGSQLALPLFLIGFLFQSLRIMDIGIIFFSAAVLFHIITLPVEFNASRRALALLGENYLDQREMDAARGVLNAAAWTYVAAATVALMWLLRLLLLRGSRD